MTSDRTGGEGPQEEQEVKVELFREGRASSRVHRRAPFSPLPPEDQARAEAPSYSSKHLKKLFRDLDSVIFTAPPPPGGLLSF